MNTQISWKIECNELTSCRVFICVLDRSSKSPDFKDVPNLNMHYTNNDIKADNQQTPRYTNLGRRKQNHTLNTQAIQS